MEPLAPKGRAGGTKEGGATGREEGAGIGAINGKGAITGSLTEGRTLDEGTMGGGTGMDEVIELSIGVEEGKCDAVAGTAGATGIGKAARGILGGGITDVGARIAGRTKGGTTTGGVPAETATNAAVRGAASGGAGMVKPGWLIASVEVRAVVASKPTGAVGDALTKPRELTVEESSFDGNTAGGGGSSMVP